MSGVRSSVLPVGRPTAFDAVTDIESLPRWNSAMTEVVERPARLSPGEEWVVEFGVLGRKWRSRSTLLELDESRGLFAYRSATDDGNPSYSEWLWVVEPHPAGSIVTVKWTLNPQTFWRKVLLSRVRHHQLKSEVSASLEALALSLRPQQH